MHEESEICFEKVKATFIADNVDTPERNDWPLGALEAANRQFGNWKLIVLTPENVRAVSRSQSDLVNSRVERTGDEIGDSTANPEWRRYRLCAKR